MKRRSVLAATGILLGTVDTGCLVSENRDGNSGNETAYLRIRNVAPDSVPLLPATPAVSVADREGTAAAPASIAIRWRNDGEESIRLGEARSVSFQTAQSDEGSAYLLGDRWREWDDTVDFEDCWFVSGTVGGDAESRTIELTPGETFEAESRLYANDNECLTGGAYRFRTSVSVRGPPGAEHAERGDWGFVLEVETER